MRGKQLYLTGLQETEAQQSKQREIRLRLDTFILSSVVMVLLLALAFSLGFERGKSAALAMSGKHTVGTTVPETVNQIQQPIALPEQNPPQVAEPQHQDKPKLDTEKQIAAETTVEPAKEGYRIQVASYKQEDAAKRETQRLIEKGYKAYQNRSGNYSAVYVGGYSNMTAAKDAFQLLRTQYKDCLLKKL